MNKTLSSPIVGTFESSDGLGHALVRDSLGERLVQLKSGVWKRKRRGQPVTVDEVEPPPR